MPRVLGPAIEYIEAKYSRPRLPNVPVLWLTMHTTENHEARGIARAVAKYFQDPPFVNGVQLKTSAHYVVDAEETIQCVPTDRVAYHVGSPVNDRSIGIELTGWHSQSEQDWADDFSTKQLAQAAALVAALCRANRIAPIRVAVPQIQQYLPGIAGHVDFTHAFDLKSRHIDPGPKFPWIKFMKQVQDAW